jgi:hypothetical protein
VGVSGPTDAVQAALDRHGIRGDIDARGEGLLSLPEGAAEDRLFRAVAEAGARLWRLKPHEPTLEQAFFHALDVRP